MFKIVVSKTVGPRGISAVFGQVVPSTAKIAGVGDVFEQPHANLLQAILALLHGLGSTLLVPTKEITGCAVVNGHVLVLQLSLGKAGIHAICPKRGTLAP